MGEKTEGIAPTFGFQIHTLPYPTEQGQVQLHLWDIGGQRTIRAYWRNYYESTDGLVFVFDAAAMGAGEQDRLTESLLELQTLLEGGRLASTSVLILANKQDCKQAIRAEEVERMVRPLMTSKQHWRVFGCAAVDEADQGCRSALDWLVGDIAQRLCYTGS